jgi:hypothetical protein
MKNIAAQILFLFVRFFVVKLVDCPKLSCQSLVKVCFVGPHKFGSLGHHFSNTCVFVYIDLDPKDVWLVNSHQSPSKFLEKYDGFLFRQSSSKFFDKVFDAGLHDQKLCQRKLWPSFKFSLRKFSVKNFDQVFDKNFDRVNGL